MELSCFFNDPADVGNLICGSSAFSKTSLNIRSSWFMYCWSLYVYFDKNLTKKKNNDSNDYFQLTHFNQVTALILKFPSAWKKEGMEEFPSFPHSMELSSRSLDPLTEVAQTLLVVSDSLQSHWLHSARFLCSWNSPGRNTGVANHSLLRGSTWPRDQTWVSCIAGRFSLPYEPSGSSDYWTII